MHRTRGWSTTMARAFDRRWARWVSVGWLSLALGGCAAAKAHPAGRPVSGWAMRSLVTVDASAELPGDWEVDGLDATAVLSPRAPNDAVVLVVRRAEQPEAVARALAKELGLTPRGGESLDGIALPSQITRVEEGRETMEPEHRKVRYLLGTLEAPHGRAALVLTCDAERWPEFEAEVARILGKLSVGPAPSRVAGSAPRIIREAPPPKPEGPEVPAAEEEP